MKKIPVLATIAAAALLTGMFISNSASAAIEQCDNDPPQGINKGKPFLEIWAAICDLQDQIDNISPGAAIEPTQLTDGTCDGSGNGWCPDDSTQTFFIPDDDVTGDSLVVISLDDAADNEEYACIVFDLESTGTEGFELHCTAEIPDGATLNYTVINP